MNRRIIGPIVAGVLIGAGLFFAPFFILRAILFFLIAGIVFRVFAGRGRFGRGRGYRFAFADRIRSMSDEEYEIFKQRASYGCGGGSTFNTTKNTQNEK